MFPACFMKAYSGLTLMLAERVRGPLRSWPTNSCWNLYQNSGGIQCQQNAWPTAERIEWFEEDWAFSRSYELAPPPPPLASVNSTGDTQEDWEKRETTFWWEGRRKRWGRSQIIRRRESLVLYKSFNTPRLTGFQVDFSRSKIQYGIMKQIRI